MMALAGAAQAAEAGWQRLNVPETGRYALRYVPPAVLDTPETAAPLVVFLHGSGATPEGWRSLLEPIADALGCVLLVPKSDSTLGFGPGDDEATLFGALAQLETQLEGDVELDPRRRALAGHSSGGAYALELAYSAQRGPAETGWSGVFSLGSPYRTILELGGPPPPLRMTYGSEDPNISSAYPALRQQWQRLGVPWEEVIYSGFGHSDWPDNALENGFAFLLAQRAGPTGPCEPTAKRLCLRDGRFAVTATWRDFRDRIGSGAVADARGADDTGLLYFFREDNWEVLVKILDACEPPYNRFWVFAAATTTVEYELVIDDLASGQQVVFSNPLGERSSAFVDTSSFNACP